MDRRSGGQLHRAPGSLIARDGCFGFAQVLGSSRKAIAAVCTNNKVHMVEAAEEGLLLGDEAE